MCCYCNVFYIVGFYVFLLFSTLDSTKALSYSAPSAINLEHSVVKFETEIESLTKESCNQLQDTENQGTDVNSGLHDWQSLSCLTDSTEQSVPINFDMSNRVSVKVLRYKIICISFVILGKTTKRYR